MRGSIFAPRLMIIKGPYPAPVPDPVASTPLILQTLPDGANGVAFDLLDSSKWYADDAGTISASGAGDSVRRVNSNADGVYLLASNGAAPTVVDYNGTLCLYFDGGSMELVGAGAEFTRPAWSIGLYDTTTNGDWPLFYSSEQSATDGYSNRVYYSWSSGNNFSSGTRATGDLFSTSLSTAGSYRAIVTDTYNDIALIDGAEQSINGTDLIDQYTGSGKLFVAGDGHGGGRLTGVIAHIVISDSGMQYGRLSEFIETQRSQFS